MEPESVTFGENSGLLGKEMQSRTSGAPELDAKEVGRTSRATWYSAETRADYDTDSDLAARKRD
jgi:hypothetical protein